ncbi:MAG: carboxypeptidase-like regulatory domain-containing protein, partial [Chitinophagaceae bacterium]
MRKLRGVILLFLFIAAARPVIAQTFHTIRGKVLDERGKPVSFATIRLIQTDIAVQSTNEGNFLLQFPAHMSDVTLSVTHIGKESVVRVIRASQFSEPIVILLRDQSLKLPDVEVNGVRTATTASNSSIVFDREAIEQI